MHDTVEKLLNWWREAVAGVGIVWSFLSDSRVLTAVTVLYTSYLFGTKLYRDYCKWKEKRRESSGTPVHFRTTPASLDD